MSDTKELLAVEMHALAQRKNTEDTEKNIRAEEAMHQSNLEVSTLEYQDMCLEIRKAAERGEFSLSISARRFMTPPAREMLVQKFKNVGFEAEDRAGFNHVSGEKALFRISWR